MREYIKNPLSFAIALILYGIALYYFSLLPHEQLIQLFRDTPEGVAGLMGLVAGMAWTLRNEI